MAFTVRDFEDLLRLLGQHPEWQAELRGLLVGDQLAAIDTMLNRLAAAQEETSRQLAALVERMDRFEQAQRRMGIDTAKLKGDSVEARYRTNLPSYLGRQLKSMRLVVPTELDRVEAASASLSDQDWEALTAIDALYAGSLRSTSDPVLLAVEASAVIDSHDVDRASNRAAILARLGYRTIPAVRGDEIVRSARRSAQERGVAVLLGGKVEHWPDTRA